MVAGKPRTPSLLREEKKRWILFIGHGGKPRVTDQDEVFFFYWVNPLQDLITNAHHLHRSIDDERRHTTPIVIPSLNCCQEIYWWIRRWSKWTKSPMMGVLLLLCHKYPRAQIISESWRPCEASNNKSCFASSVLNFWFMGFLNGDFVVLDIAPFVIFLHNLIN